MWSNQMELEKRNWQRKKSPKKERQSSGQLMY